ncbi:uncharacterized protein LOC124652863 [Lolium rigidum]|uniref:uncharacterized protein LOC124652863 n=1 Tax=Lolium rigidum TaxID=89674 RepID=UPI001F5D1165|nr:uncharacterized protein LOC124652863 [Lolium rigidum]
MDASQLQAFSRATLLGLVLASMVTLVPHGFSCLRSLLSLSLPSAASAIVTPKQCLFIFSNIIVVFLARESKLLSQNGARSSLDDEIDSVVRELAVFEPSIKENHAGAEETVGEERGVDEAAVLMSTQQLDQCEKTSTTLGVKEMPGEEGEEEASELPADELNRRVEDFIARFNMERQLEERTMVVCF